MMMRQTIFNDWITDFRKILFCIGILALGTLFNAEEPKALAIAIIVQGAGNIDNFWDYLKDDNILNYLKAMILMLILFSALAVTFAIFTLGNSKGYFDMAGNTHAWIFILVELFAIAFPIIPLITDAIINAKNKKTKLPAGTDGGEDDEL